MGRDEVRVPEEIIFHICEASLTSSPKRSLPRPSNASSPSHSRACWKQECRPTFSSSSTVSPERLKAIAQAEGMTLKEVPEVLFACVPNAGRSQMAAALLDRAAKGRVHVRSAGSAPANEIHDVVREAMDEVGIDLSKEFPKPLTDEVVRAADVVITMGVRRRLSCLSWKA